LKPSIAKVYEILIGNVYQRAGFIAHTKIAYKPCGEDFYDERQYIDVELSNYGEKYRRN